LAERPRKRHAGAGKGGKPIISRAKRDAKYGFGGKVGWRAKQNTKESTGSIKAASGKQKMFGAGGKRGPAKRLGKSRRMKTAGKR